MLQFFFMDIVAMLANLSFEQGKFPTSYSICYFLIEKLWP